MPKRARRRSDSTITTRQNGSVNIGRWLQPREVPESYPPDEETYLQRSIDVRHMTNGEWVWDVLVVLHRGPSQYTELLNAIQKRSTDDGWPGRQHRHLRDSTLNRTLRRLEQSELVVGIREPEFPYHATYQLTDAARNLLVAEEALVKWAEQHGDLVERVRQRRHDDNSVP
ncbi:winged helix-turn-helix transcriptional regulator [Streptomyces sp. NPDC021224]|uniref:winged helix-turn-helix transcriptional regulator n=1 Tax=unclassified Streptomyces TaxID=2593676 RepID=UPI0037B3C198